MEIQDFISDGPVGGQFNVNLYYEPDTIYGVPGLVSTPGLDLGVDLGDNVPVRGMLEYRNVLYIVAGQNLYTWTGSGSATERSTGTLDSSTGYVWMAANGNDEIVMVDRSTAKLFTWTISNVITGAGTWTEPATPGGIVPSSVTYQDTFFIIGNAEGREIYCSGIDDATTWSTTEVSTKMGAPDLIQAIISEGLNLWVFGENTTEIWYYTGAASGLPFTRVGGGLLDVGCWAPNSVCVLAESVFWLNHRGEVCKTTGHSYEVVSRPQLNNELQYIARVSGGSYLDDAIGMPLVWNGHPWYVLHLAEIGGTRIATIWPLPQQPEGLVSAWPRHRVQPTPE